MFKLSPILRLSFISHCTSSSTDTSLPPIVTSSRYPKANSDLREHNRGCRVRLKRSGPSGSPCCTPSLERISLRPYLRMLGSSYDKQQKASNSGTDEWTAASMESLLMELKALLQSSLATTQSSGMSAINLHLLLLLHILSGIVCVGRGMVDSRK